MKINNKTSAVILSVIIILSLAASTFFMAGKQGYHEDELLTYNLANSSKQLETDGGRNTSDDFREYLTVDKNDRFDYAQVYANQITDASHPPLYYALVHTVCSLFPEVFSKYLAYSVNVLAMTGVLIMLYKIAKKVCKNNFYTLIAVFAYAMSIACITTTIYLRMYAVLTFFVLSTAYMNLKLYEQKNGAKLRDCIVLGIVILLGTLTQYYFILFELLYAIIFTVFKIKEKHLKALRNYIIALAFGSLLALCVYPYIIANVLGGSRGFGSISISIDFITIVTYFIYKIFTYFQILAKDVFLNQVWLFAVCAVCALIFTVYRRFFKKQKVSRSAFLTFVPSIVFFAAVSLVSPFNSDRYIMASLPLIVTLFVFIFIKITLSFKNKRIIYAAAVCVALACAVGLFTVTPYYVYGKQKVLYEPQTETCVFVGTAMLEWNKSIDKLMNYDETVIVRTNKLSPTLADELEDFAEKRGVITNGKINEIIGGYMNNGGEKEETDSMSALKSDEKLKNCGSVTVYISRLADKDFVIDYITENTEFTNYELIQADYSFEDYYNWYDYFADTESYCNVYRFY